MTDGEELNYCAGAAMGSSIILQALAGHLRSHAAVLKEHPPSEAVALMAELAAGQASDIAELASARTELLGWAAEVGLPPSASTLLVRDLVREVKDRVASGWYTGASLGRE